jgi:uncharacterized protein (UPF0333 family)
MFNRTKIAVLFLVAVIFIGIVAALFTIRKGGEKPAEKEKAAVVVSETSAAAVAPASEEAKKEIAVKALAVAFVERFGSFSNQGDYLNLQELLNVMTPTMANWVKSSYLPKLKKERPADGFYYAISTKAPVVEVLSEKAEAVKLKVTTKRDEQIAGQENKEFLQEITLDLVKQNNNWLVDGAYWGNKK